MTGPLTKQQKVGVACLAVNVVGESVYVAQQILQLRNLAWLGLSDFMIYGVFALVAVRFKVWPAAHQVIRVLGVTDVVLASYRLIYVAGSMPTSARIDYLLILPCAASAVVFTTLSLLRPKDDGSDA